MSFSSCVAIFYGLQLFSSNTLRGYEPMNAPVTKLPAHDDITEDTVWGDHKLSGQLLVEYDEDSYTSGDERFVTDCDVTIIGLHIGGNFVLDRNALVQIASNAAVEHFETVASESRVSA